MTGPSSSFGPFLETRHLLRKGAPAEESKSSGAPRSQDELTRSAALSLRLIVDHAFPLPTHELLRESEMPLEEFTEGLNALHKADLITVTRDTDAGEVVDLTPKGHQLKKVARPAA